ncbi:hypothetical protein Ancab_014330 [Ancistrocladus abbreviatus]
MNQSKSSNSTANASIPSTRKSAYHRASSANPQANPPAPSLKSLKTSSPSTVTTSTTLTLSPLALTTASNQVSISWKSASTSISGDCSHVAKVVKFEADDPIASMQWILSFLLRDLSRLENQLPLFVLERLWDVTRSETERESGWSVVALSLNFFSYAAEKLDPQKSRDVQGKHLLDLLRSAFIPPELETKQRDLGKVGTPSHVIHNVSKLSRAGIEIRPIGNDSFLTVNFRCDVLEMPTITLDDFMSAFVANCVAYELSHKDCATFFTTYAMLLNCLVKSSRDVGYLIDNNVIENYFGTEADIMKFVNNLGKDVSFDISRCYLAELFNQVNNPWACGLMGRPKEQKG